MSIKFKKINNTIIKCKKCSRLIKFSKKISIDKRKQNINEIYWGKPVPGFGDINAKLLIIGLAPAAHGGTRTGRVFTGDKSGDFLFKCLKAAKISNQDESTNINDGLEYKIDTLNQQVVKLDKEIDKQDKKIVTLKYKVNEKINSVDNFNDDELERFFTERYRYIDSIKKTDSSSSN